MNKKQLKREKKHKRLCFELSLIMGSYSFLYSKYKSALQSEKDIEQNEGVNLDELKPTEDILKKYKKIITLYKPVHNEALSYISEAIEKADTCNANTFLLGISLLNYHSELYTKTISVAHSKEVFEMGAAFEKHLSNDIKNRTYNLANIIYDNLIDVTKVENIPKLVTKAEKFRKIYQKQKNS